jgi:polar amino acid transport system substrate-binding protein
MRRIRLSLGAMCIAGGLLAAVPAAASASGQRQHSGGDYKLAHPGTLTVAASSTPPDFILAATGKISGVQPDSLRTFAREHHLKIVFDRYSFSGSLTAVESGRADITGGFYYTKTRAKAVFYTYMTSKTGSYLVYLKSTTYKNPSTFLGKNVGVAAGYAQVPYLTKYLGSSHVLQFTADPAGIEAVKTGRVVGFVSGSTVLWFLRGDKTLKAVRLKQGTFDQPKTVTTVTSGMLVSCRNKALGEAVDVTLKKMWQDGSLKKIQSGYGFASVFPPKLVSKPNLCGKK